MKTVLIAGGSGLVGKRLTDLLLKKKFNVRWLSRSRKTHKAVKVFEWNIEQQTIDNEAFTGVDVIINLAGTSIADKSWSAEQKEKIVMSRTGSAQLLFKTVKELPVKPECYLSASAVGWYGAVSSEQILAEDMPATDDFLGTTCRLWESEADKFSQLATRVVKIRIGVVLAKEGGILSKTSFPMKIGLGAALGSGKQYIAWIHIDDLCQIFVHAIENTDMTGAFNAVAPNHVTNKEFFRTMAKVLGRPFFMPNVPAFTLKIALGEMADMLLKGSRISCDKIKNTGFKFQYEQLNDALKDILYKQ